MEKLALVSLLTQSSEPVLTHHRLLSTDVTERTHPACEWKHTKIQHNRVKYFPVLMSERLDLPSPSWKIHKYLVVSAHVVQKASHIGIIF